MISNVWSRTDLPGVWMSTALDFTIPAGLVASRRPRVRRDAAGDVGAGVLWRCGVSAIDLAVKTCTKCGETKPLSEFYRHPSTRDRRQSECGACTRARVREREAERRAEMGDDAWLENRRRTVRRSRRNPDVLDRSRRNSNAYSAALFALRDAHREQFESLLARERYERGLE